ncbi:MAG: hypothetical protein OXI61_13780 [Candidatus Poribacteria bacterium]|nr:hypothetical protein [Candidatus Poribacteria bacterium]
MSQDKTHDLYDFMRQLQNDMAAEYNRIQKRATEDPGTAGDQGEENWAELLRGWLPRTYEVVTKGRIIGIDGCPSPQVDVLVLKNVYPKSLLKKKLFLAAGVAAAFECKTTLKSEHIEKAVETCVKIKNLYPVREGTPYKELHAPIVYGLLAHSHSWKGDNSTPEDNIQQKLIMSDDCHVSHPRQGLDLLCVADLATWTFSKVTFLSQLSPQDPNKVLQDAEMITTYTRWTAGDDIQVEDFTSIGVLISNLSKRLAWEDSTLRDLADYYHDIKLTSTGSGIQRRWQAKLIYSSEVFSGFGIRGPFEVHTLI